MPLVNAVGDRADLRFRTDLFLHDENVDQDQADRRSIFCSPRALFVRASGFKKPLLKSLFDGAPALVQPTKGGAGLNCVGVFFSGTGAS